jgi:hypothetical protein
MLVDKHNYSIEHFIKSYPIVSTEGKRFHRFEHLKYAMSKASVNGSVLEFGVWRAHTTNYIADLVPTLKVYGFDSFEGLPEDWAVYEREIVGEVPIHHKKGMFARKLPKVRDNVELIKGFFDASLNPWLEKNPQVNPIKFLHVDSDLYSSAKFVLTTLNEYIIPGTIIVFDELYHFKRKGYDTWPEHEYKAIFEWISENNRVFEPLSHSQHQQAAIKVVQ